MPTAQQEGKRAVHEPEAMVRTEKPSRYHNKNWSAQFRCPSCGFERWHSLNYLGQRVLHCNGKKSEAIGPYGQLRRFRADTATLMESHP